MIKGDYFGKLLKQLFSIGLISCFTLLVGSSVSSYYNVGTTVDNFLLCDRNPYGYFSDFPCENTCTISSNLNFSCSSSNNKIIFTNYRNYYQTAFYRTNEGLFRYAISNFSNNTCGSNSYYNSEYVRPYLFTGFTLCEGDYYPNTSPNISACPGSGTVLSYTGMLEYIKNSGGIIGFDFNLPAGNIGDVGLAFIGNGYYFQATVYNTYGNLGNQQFRFGNASLDYGNVSNSCTSGDYKVLLSTSFPGVINSPLSLVGVGSGNGSGIDYITIGLTGQDYIDYFENNPNYNFNKNICYVGTNDLTTTGISGIPYYEGTGKNIVQLFASLYGNTFTTKNLGSFLDTWNINYGTWYLYGNRDVNNNPLYNAYYTLTGGFYQDFGDNLTNPFLNSLTAIFFMASNISDYGNRSTLGEEISTYCYYKLQSENPIVFSGINLTDNHNSAIDNNVSDLIDSWRRNNYTYSGINVVSQSWGGSDVDYFSGQDDLDFLGFFSDSMNKLKSAFNVSDFDLGVGFLPGYIIFFLLALILFRFLSH